MTTEIGGTIMKISEMQAKAYETARDKGWHDPEHGDATVGDRLALIHAEVSEALEAYRDLGLHAWKRDDGKPEGVASELADVVIRIGDFCGKYGLDLEAAIASKMAYNATRPHRHGGKKL